MPSSLANSHCSRTNVCGWRQVADGIGVPPKASQTSSHPPLSFVPFASSWFNLPAGGPLPGPGVRHFRRVAGAEARLCPGTVGYEIPSPVYNEVMWSSKRRILLSTGLGIGLIVTWAIISGPSSADIRLDTGDLRYRYLGIPVVYERMPEPQRSRLQSLASQSSVLVDEWHQCADFPLPTTNNTDGMCLSFYMRADAWIDVDQNVARLALEDVATYIRDTHARESLPHSFALLNGFVIELTDDHRYAVRSEWREDEAVRTFFESHGIPIPPPNP